MNQIVKEAIDNIKKRVDLTDRELSWITYEIGEVMQQVYHGCKTNPNLNFKGGDSADENSYVPRMNIDFAEMLRGCKSYDEDTIMKQGNDFDTRGWNIPKTKNHEECD